MGGTRQYVAGGELLLRLLLAMQLLSLSRRPENLPETNGGDQVPRTYPRESRAASVVMFDEKSSRWSPHAGRMVHAQRQVRQSTEHPVEKMEQWIWSLFSEEIGKVSCLRWGRARSVH